MTAAAGGAAGAAAGAAAGMNPYLMALMAAISLFGGGDQINPQAQQTNPEMPGSSFMYGGMMDMLGRMLGPGRGPMPYPGQMTPGMSPYDQQVMGAGSSMLSDLFGGSPVSSQQADAYGQGGMGALPGSDYFYYGLTGAPNPIMGGWGSNPYWGSSFGAPPPGWFPGASADTSDVSGGKDPIGGYGGTVGGGGMGSVGGGGTITPPPGYGGTRFGGGGKTLGDSITPGMGRTFTAQGMPGGGGGGGGMSQLIAALSQMLGGGGGPIPGQPPPGGGPIPGQPPPGGGPIPGQPPPGGGPIPGQPPPGRPPYTGGSGGTGMLGLPGVGTSPAGIPGATTNPFGLNQFTGHDRTRGGGNPGQPGINEPWNQWGAGGGGKGDLGGGGGGGFGSGGLWGQSMGLLGDTLGGKYTDIMGNPIVKGLTNASEAGLRKDYGERMQEVQNMYTQAGVPLSGAAAAGLGREQGNMENAIAQSRYGAYMPLYEQERQRQQGALGLGTALPMQGLQMQSQISALPRQLKQQGLSMQMGDWTRGQDMWSQIMQMVQSGALGGRASNLQYTNPQFSPSMISQLTPLLPFLSQMKF